jgi:hypothetical protein
MRVSDTAMNIRLMVKLPPTTSTLVLKPLMIKLATTLERMVETIDESNAVVEQGLSLLPQRDAAVGLVIVGGRRWGQCSRAIQKQQHQQQQQQRLPKCLPQLPRCLLFSRLPIGFWQQKLLFSRAQVNPWPSLRFHFHCCCHRCLESLRQ